MGKGKGNDAPVSGRSFGYVLRRVSDPPTKYSRLDSGIKPGMTTKRGLSNKANGFLICIIAF